MRATVKVCQVAMIAVLAFLIAPFSVWAVTIDNGVTDNNNDPIEGFWQVDVQEAGNSSNGILYPTVAGVTSENVFFDFTYYVDVGIDGNAMDLGDTATSGPTQSNGEVTSSGSFQGPNGTIEWTSTSRIPTGEVKYITVFEFSSDSAFGDVRIISYLDEDVEGFSDDVLVVLGTPGNADFELLTVDNSLTFGVSQSASYTQAQGLQNMTYEGWAADQYDDLETAITGAGTTYTVAGNVDTNDLPALAHQDYPNTQEYGPADITSAMAFDLDPGETTAGVTFAIGGSVSGEGTGGVGGDEGDAGPPSQTGTGLGAPVPGLPKTADGLNDAVTPIGGTLATIIEGANPVTEVLTRGANVMVNATADQQRAYDDAVNVGQMGTALRAFWTGLPGDFVPGWEPTTVKIDTSQVLNNPDDFFPIIIGPVTPANYTNKTVDDLTVYKLLPSGNLGSTELITIGSVGLSNESSNGQYRVFNAETGNELNGSSAIPDEGVIIMLYIKDNGAWDSDSTVGTITDTVVGGFIGGGIVPTGGGAPLPSLPGTNSALNSAVSAIGGDVQGLLAGVNPVATVATKGANVMANASNSAKQAYNSASNSGEMGNALRQFWSDLPTGYRPGWEPTKVTVTIAQFPGNVNNVYPVIIGPVTPANSSGQEVEDLDLVKLLPDGSVGETTFITSADTAFGSESADGQYRVFDAGSGNELTGSDPIPSGGVYIFFYIEEGGAWDEDANPATITDPASGGFTVATGVLDTGDSGGCSAITEGGFSVELTLLLLIPVLYWARRRRRH